MLQGIDQPLAGRGQEGTSPMGYVTQITAGVLAAAGHCALQVTGLDKLLL